MNKIFDKLLGLVLILSLACFGLLIGGYLIPMYDSENQDTVVSNTDYIDNNEVVNSVDYTSDSDLTLDEAQKGIVTIYAQTDSEEVESQGSGFMYTDNHIMTNEHVTRGTSTYYVKFQDGTWSEAEFVGADTDTDIAILKPDDIPANTPVLPMRYNQPQVGESVIAIGSPSGLDTTQTTGVVSSTNVLMNIETEFGIPDTIQTDAALNPGNSGGPLLSQSEESVIGVNRATVGENRGYAISSRLAHKVGQSIIEDGRHKHGFIGLSTNELNPDSSLYNNVSIDSGLIVTNVTESGPSDNLQLLSEDDNYTTPDIVTEVDGSSVSTNEELISHIALNKTIGDTMELTIYRDGETIVEEVRIEDRLEYN